jgi:PAS domain S-box-containing protein
MAGLIPLLSIFFAIGLFSQHLKGEFDQSLEDLKSREWQRLQEQQHTHLDHQLRQKTLDVAQQVALYLKAHPSRSWEDLRRDPEFRQIAVQPIGLIGETFLLDPQERRVLLHSRTSSEGQVLENIFPSPHLDRFLTDHHKKNYGRGNLYEYEAPTAPRQLFRSTTPFVAVLMQVSVRPRGGPDLMVGAMADPQAIDQQATPSRAILKTAMNQGSALVDTRLRDFRRHTFIFLVCLGFLGLLGSWALARRQTRAIEALTQAAEAYNAGDLDYRLPHPGRDELGHLANTFNLMAAGLKENTVSRTEWESTFNIIPDQIMVLDAEQRIIRLNRAAAEYLGVSPEEAVGRICYELIYQASAPPPFCPYPQALEEGTQRQVELCCEGKNGLTFLVTVDPLRDREGKIVGRVRVARDITTLKQVQRELAQTSHFLTQVIESAPVAVTVVNREGLFTHVNPQFFQEYGYTREDLLNKHFSMLYADEAEMRQVLEELRARGEVVGRRTLFRHKSGISVPTRLSIRKLWGADGELLGSVGLGRNISEEISLQNQLEQVQKLEAVATLSGGLAHNFNNLLMIILGLASLMLSKIDPGHPFYPDLMEVEKQVLAGRELTRELLTFARGASFEKRPLNLNDLARATTDMFARTHKDLVVIQDLAPNLPPVEADPSQIQQVLMNLLINAGQAMPQGGKIIITTRSVDLTEWRDPAWELQPGPFVSLSVGDTGVGMAEETLRHIFEPFFTTKEPGQGTGLGLTSAYRIIKDHGGAIQVKSRLGQGSTFILFLPVSQSQPQVLPLEESHVIPGQATILVVDDEPVLRRVVARLLEKLGHRVLQASGGERALEIFRERSEEIDLILLDLIMPGMNGLQTLTRIRALSPKVRVLLCSGYADREGGELPPGVSFLSKPFSLELLSQKVAAALKRELHGQEGGPAG